MEIRVGMHDDATAGTISDWISGSSTFPARLHYKIDITNLGLITLFAKSAAAAAADRRDVMPESDFALIKIVTH